MLNSVINNSVINNCKGGITITMGKSGPADKKLQEAQKEEQKAKKKTFAIAGVIAVFIIGFIIIKISSGGAGATGGADTTGTALGGIKILKSEVSETAKFYPYKAGKVKMEVLAVRASDGTIRTAFNTCQVCYDSGRGYYKQQGDELVCQNCGNRFQLDQIEKIKGGCNPVPIMKENKTEDDAYIVIPKAFMEENKGLFGGSNSKK